MRSGKNVIHCVSAMLLSLSWTAFAHGPIAAAQPQPPVGEDPASPIAQTTPQAAPATSSPRIVFSGPIHDFGKVEQGAQVTHLFRFTNQGAHDLRIESVKTSCGCTAAVISADVIPPGGEGTISATFDTTRFAGEKAKSIAVYSNDPLQPVTTLTLQGEITIEVAADPPQLYLGRLRRGEGKTGTIEVLSDTAKGISIVKVENSHPAVSLRTEDLQKEDRQGKKIHVTLKKDVSLGRFNDQITVTTTSSKKPTIVIPVFGSIEGDLLVQPPQVSFGVVRQGEGKTQEVSIKNRAKKPVHLLRAQSSVADVTPELTAVKDGAEYRLTISAKAESKPGRIQGEVQVFTDHAEETVLTIPLYGMVADGQQARK
jgi:hypothetical protein